MNRLFRAARAALPIILDTAGFAAITLGVWLLAGEWALIVAGVGLILAGYRAQS